MKNTIFKGSATALVTPINETGVDFDALKSLVEFQIENGTDALVICGTTGEAPTLEDGEHLDAIECAVSCTKGRIPVIAGTGSNNTDHAIRIDAEVSDGYVRVNLMSIDDRDYYVEIEYRILAWEEYETVYEELAPDNAEGYKDGDVITTPYTGYKSEGWKIKYSKEMLQQLIWVIMIIWQPLHQVYMMEESLSTLNV